MTHQEVLADLVRRTCNNNIFLGDWGKGPCVTTDIDSTGEETLRHIQRELGGFVFISGEGGRLESLPSIWTIHHEEAINVMRELIPLLKVVDHPSARSKMSFAGNCVSWWDARKWWPKK